MVDVSRNAWPGWVLAGALTVGGCATPRIEGVIRPESGAPPLRSLPGPMPGFGPFDSYSDALIAACPLILSKPHATAGRRRDQNFQLRWRISSEYCAWLYYTPDARYEMSMLTDQYQADDLGRKKTCRLPVSVEDPRYPPESLKYVFALHNHPYEDRISDDDIRGIVSKGLIHGFEVEARGERIQLSIIAFFSTSNDPSQPTCDGFLQYVPKSGQLLKWTRTSDRWDCQQTGRVRWLDEEHFQIEARQAPCRDADGSAS